MSDPRAGVFTATIDGTPLVSEMTLRDYFAGQVLAGVLSDGATVTWLSEISREGGFDLGVSASRMAYEMADAMLKARGES